MSPEDTDRAIEALPEIEHDELCDAAFQHWRFRAQNWALAIAVLVVAFAVFHAMREWVREYWPGSLVAGTLATSVWCCMLYGLIRLVSSWPVSRWRTRWAMHREYRRRFGVP